MTFSAQDKNFESHRRDGDNGNPFERQLRWGLTAGPLTYDPPVTDVAQFKLVDHMPPPDSPRPVASPYKLQAEPARKWKNLQNIPIAWMTSEFGAGGSPVANLASKTTSPISRNG